jgi:hypothetical protein
MKDFGKEFFVAFCTRDVEEEEEIWVHCKKKRHTLI